MFCSIISALGNFVERAVLRFIHLTPWCPMIGFGAPKTAEGEAKDLFILIDGHTVHRVYGTNEYFIWSMWMILFSPL